MGLALSGAPFGGLLYSLVFRSLLTNCSFAWAARGIGFIGLVTLGVAAVIIDPRDRNRKSPHRRFMDWSALRNLAFISLLLDFFFAYCAALVPNFLAPSFTAGLGHPPSENLAYLLVALLNAAQVLGRILPAFLSDHLSSGATYLLFFAQLLIALLGLSWISITSLAQFIPWLIFTGFFAGTVATLPPLVVRMSRQICGVVSDLPRQTLCRSQTAHQTNGSFLDTAFEPRPEDTRHKNRNGLRCCGFWSAHWESSCFGDRENRSRCQEIHGAKGLFGGAVVDGSLCCVRGGFLCHACDHGQEKHQGEEGIGVRWITHSFRSRR